MRSLGLVPAAAALLLAASPAVAGTPAAVPASADNGASAPLAVHGATDNAAAVPRVSLADAVRASLERGREARMAEQDVRIAEEGRARAGARYLPRVDASADYTALSEPPSIFMQGGAVQTMDQNVGRARVTAEQTIYDFGKTSSRVSQAAARRDAAEWQADATRARAAMETIAAFLAGRRAEELATVAEESLETARAHRKVAGDQYELGVVARNDVLAADVQVANGEAAVIAAANRVEIAHSRLALRMGHPGDRAVGPAPGEFPVPPEAALSLDDSVRAAASTRPEMRAQAALVREAEASAASARSEFAPTLFGQGGYSYETNDYNPHKSVFSFLAGGKVNLFAGGGDAAARREALVAAERRREALALLGDEIALAVKSARLAIVEAEKRTAVAATAVARAEENLRIQNDRYREGLAISTEVLDAETLLTRAKVDLRNATHDVFESRYRLLHARGELLDFLRPLIGGPASPAAPAAR